MQVIDYKKVGLIYYPFLSSKWVPIVKCEDYSMLRVHVHTAHSIYVQYTYYNKNYSEYAVSCVL